MSFYKEDREKSMAAMAADGAGARKDQKTSVEGEEPKAGVEKATKAETTVSAPPEEPKPKVKAVHEATDPSAQLASAQLGEISTKLDKILESLGRLVSVMAATNRHVSELHDRSETLEAISESVSTLAGISMSMRNLDAESHGQRKALEAISENVLELTSTCRGQSKALNELVSFVNEPAEFEESDILTQLAEIRGGVLPLEEISTTMRDLVSESHGQSGILEAIYRRVEPLTEIPGMLGASRDRLDEIGERILSLRAEPAGAEESTEAERRAVTVYIYPTLNGLKRTIDLRQAEEESMDPEMIRSYLGWDVPEENYPKLTSEEINNLSLME